MRERLGGWFWSLVFVISWLWNRTQLVFFSHAACRGCGWVLPRSRLTVGLCPGCVEELPLEEYLAYLEFEHDKALEEVERDPAFRRAIADAWRDYGEGS